METTVQQLLPAPPVKQLIDGVAQHPLPENTFRDLNPTNHGNSGLCGFDLFSLFTANIIRDDVTFVR